MLNARLLIIVLAPLFSVNTPVLSNFSVEPPLVSLRPAVLFMVKLPAFRNCVPLFKRMALLTVPSTNQLPWLFTARLFIVKVWPDPLWMTLPRFTRPPVPPPLIVADPFQFSAVLIVKLFPTPSVSTFRTPPFKARLLSERTPSILTIPAEMARSPA